LTLLIFIYLHVFIVLSFVSQLPALDKKKETQNASVETCVIVLI